MKSIHYILITFSVILLFSNCEEEVISPGNPTNPTGLPNYFIVDCDTMQVDITFTGTNFFNEDDGSYFTIDGVQDWNHMCSQYIDEPAMIAAGLTYIDIWTSTVVPIEYGSRAELKYDASDPTNPMLEIDLTNDDSPGNIYRDYFSLSLEIQDINSKSPNTPYTILKEDIWFGNVMVYNQYYQMECIITFDIIDVPNKKFEGEIGITFFPILDYYDPITGLPHYRDYPSGTTFPFTADVDFKFICRP